jgi:Flp pilus assembly protein TadG
VEFSLVVSLLMTLFFGIVVFGVLLAVRQTITQSAAEGARAAVPVRYSAADLDSPGAPPVVAARAAAARSVAWLHRTCDAGDADGDGLACDVTMHDCNVTAGATTGPNDPNQPDCMTVRIVVDQEHHPVVPAVPLISRLVPRTLSSTAVSELDNLLVE